MSYFTTITSACGAVTSPIDIYDIDLNPHGSVCCDACRSIIATRESWAKEYDYTF